MQQIELAKIRLDGGTQPRAEIDTDLVSEYRDRMADGDTFPPVEVVFDGTDYWCWDGHHRVLAARRNGDNAIFANVRQGTLRDAVYLSLGANKRHGKRRESGDISRSVEKMLLDDEWGKMPQTKIAEHVGCSQQLVSKLYQKLHLTTGSKIDRSTSTVTRNGKTYEMNTANIGRKSKSSDKPQSTSQPSPDDAEADEVGTRFSTSGDGGSNGKGKDAPAKPEAPIDKYPWESFNREVREQIKVVRREVDRLGRIMGHSGKSFKSKWAYFISADGTIGAMRRALDSIDDNLPGGPHPKEPGFEPYRSVKLRAK